MASENAKAVAQEVIETVGKGRKVVLGKIVKKHGYSDSVSKYPKKVTDTIVYPLVPPCTPIREWHSRGRRFDPD
jgi:hypothetical protein